jgi:hypothetical protein
MTHDYDDFYDDEGITCPRCSGFGEVDCHCGGDLCVCLNYGDKPCPLCVGDGCVSEEVYDRYLESQRKAHEAFQQMMDGEKGQP